MGNKNKSNLFTDVYGMIKSKLGERRLRKKLTNKLMEGYPAGTLIGNRKYSIRRKQVEQMIKDGKIADAKKFIKNKTAEFNKLNYDSQGKPKY